MPSSPPSPPPQRSSSSRPYSSHHLSYQIYGDHSHSLLRENLMREGTFDITFRVYRHGRWPSSNNFELQFTLNIPYQALHQYDLTSVLMRQIHHYDLSHDDIQELASHIMSRLHSLLQDYSTYISLLPPSFADIARVVSTTPRTAAIVEESMRRQATEKAMASLEKVEVCSGKAKAERCSICMEDFEEDDEDVLRMPWCEEDDREDDEDIGMAKSWKL
ncbi:uncharacterized protein G2W53_028274 [Senna tora]|uniref:Uncharacterized protein n=1 Tax=Senna tora TaxID=362788 RepID=A0A834T465_9FABA|nr:uncharacterized protein G2W53_028274 [Senna tora]